MTDRPTAYVGPAIFDGSDWHEGHALVVEGDRVAAIAPATALPPDHQVQQLPGGVIAPGFVDLQVNGGGGVMLNEDPSITALGRIAAAHATLGATSILPTLITDAPEKTVAAIDAVAAAIAQDMPGIIGLHLEGPHLSVRRKGAHDPGFIRPMTDGDVARLQDAAQRLPVLTMTVAVENVTPAQIHALTEAGVLVSLGHSEASFVQAAEAVAAGASCATHLFNAMSQLGNREPGLVGAALAHGQLSAGMIADGVHVHPANVGIALRAKRGPGRIFLVSDAMSVAGTAETGFDLGGRQVLRRDGRLTLLDGTLAGADLDLLTAVRNLIGWGHADAATALAMASSVPATLVGGGPGLGRLVPGGRADFQHIDLGGTAPATVWQRGQRVS